MFKPSKQPHVFGLEPGVDFATALVDGLIERSNGQNPSALAHVELFVNTRRMARRVKEIFDQRGSLLLPRIRLVTDLADDPVAADIPAAIAPLRRRLELTNFIARLLESEPDLAPQSALYDLSDSLAGLMDELHGEGVDPETIKTLDVSDQSGHWARALKFISIISNFYSVSESNPDTEARQRMVVERLTAQWEKAPPEHPVIIAGSTGSRGTTAILMDAVARLPQGALILPGFDFDLPSSVWASMDRQDGSEDHPQFRHKLVTERIGLIKNQVEKWSLHPCPSSDRNKVVSLSLRPAPVTDQWLAEGPKLGDLAQAMQDVSMLEAPSPRIEAESIALLLRQAVQDGKRAALITPDRGLTRQVGAALDRWNIVPDDSAGQPLALTPPGRFLRQVGELIGTRLTSEALLALLKHPLTHSNREDRRDHLLRTRRLELHIRRYGPPFPDRDSLVKWANGKASETDEGLVRWAKWLGACLSGLADVDEQNLSAHVALHRKVAEQIAAGPDTGPDAGSAGGLWDEAAGRKALQTIAELETHSDAGGVISARNYTAMFAAILSKGEVRNPDTVHPDVQFLGTLEARVQGADFIILGSMNDGVWPEAAAPDPWLNRKMRKDAGLLLPERRIGLSAHDYEQAIAGKEVWVTRAIRTEEAETVPSRWLNRLINLLEGLPAQGGTEALANMRNKGAELLSIVAASEACDDRVAPENRPSPRPPVNARPKELSITQIKTLIRDPYAIYAERVLGLRALDPLVQSPDAPTRGTVIHKILEKLIKSGIEPDAPDARDTMMEITQSVLEDECPWPTIRRMWTARIERVADWFLETEIERRQNGTPAFFEEPGRVNVGALDFAIKGKADRIDETPDGQVILYDYKTGQVPTQPQQINFDKQLLLEAAMVERGAFAKIGPKRAADAQFIGLGGTPSIVKAPLAKHPTDEVWTQFEKLMQTWAQQDRGYTARLALFSQSDVGYFDHLSRFGEWDLTTKITPEDME